MSDVQKRLKDLRVADLKLELDKRGLPTTGVKAVLADRLKGALESAGIDPEEYVFNKEDNSEEQASKAEIEESEENSESHEDGQDLKKDDQDDMKESETDPVKDNKSAVNPDEDQTEQSSEIADSKITTEEKEQEDDSLNIMVGDEDNLFGEEEKINGVPGSPPRPETAPVKHPFTSKDTITLSSRSDKPPSENSSMRVNPDESQSVASHDSNEGSKEIENKSSSSNEKLSSSEKPSGDSIKNLWVSGLTNATKAAELKAVFNAHGKVLGAKIVTNSRSAGARCFGYVTLATPEDAARCIEKLNKTELDGCLIIVEKATADSGPNRPERKDVSSRSSETVRNSSSREQSRRDDRHKSQGTHRPVHSHHGAQRSTPVWRDDRRADMNVNRYSGGQRQNERNSGAVLTFNQIKDQRRREREREEERRRRDRERRRVEDEERRRKEALRRQRDEEELRREREELKREREKLELEKQELMKFERERQKMERDKLEREKEELQRLRRQQLNASRMDDRRGSKRPSDNRESYGDRKRIVHREEFSSVNRGTFDGNVRRADDRSVSNRYERSSRDMMIGRDVHSSSRNMAASSSRDMTTSRGGSRDQVNSRDFGSSREMNSRSMGSAREQGNGRESGRMGNADYRSSRSGTSHGGHSGSRSGMGSAHSGSHGAPHSGNRGTSHGGSSGWSGHKSSGNYSGSGNNDFPGNQGNIETWSRGLGVSMQNQGRNMAIPGMSLPLGGITPFAQLATSALMSTMGANSLGSSPNVDRYDGYKPALNPPQSRRY